MASPVGAFTLAARVLSIAFNMTRPGLASKVTDCACRTGAGAIGAGGHAVAIDATVCMAGWRQALEITAAPIAAFAIAIGTGTNAIRVVPGATHRAGRGITDKGAIYPRATDAVSSVAVGRMVMVASRDGSEG